MIRSDRAVDGGEWVVSRRDFLRVSAGVLATLATGCGRWGAPAAPRRTVRLGFVTDSHYADADRSGSRYYRESLAKMREAVDRLRADGAELLIHLGDIKDMAAGEPPERTLAHLAAIEAEIARFGGPTFHVLGNHDMDNISKPQALARITNTGITRDRSYYAFDHGGLRFIVLDACYLAGGADYDRGNFDWRDTNVPDHELAWLERELAGPPRPTIVCVHQRLDGEGDVFVNNSPQVRALLERSGRVLAVFAGHDHAGAWRRMGGIHYYTQRAMVEGSGEANNAYTLVEVHPSLDIVVTGYRRAVSRALPRGADEAAAA